MRYSLAADELHLWYCPLQELPETEEQTRLYVSEEEQERLARIRAEESRVLALRVRASVRRIVSGYAGCSARELPIVRTPAGKPLLGEPYAALKFNLAHSGSWLGVAVAWQREIGIDLERVRRDDPEYRLRLARRFFHPQESEALSRLPPARIAAGFFTSWVRKEAYIKCWGGTIAQHSQRFALTVDPEQPAERVSAHWQEGQDTKVSIQDVWAPLGFCAAVVLSGSLPPLLRRRFWPADAERAESL
ncbi:4'-phosphopantetheinyl transferase family protein [Candidatus Magnetaquicoccus inordinatus]|uniref:4'-phosphopantetheinyl transferase family protein n=1 Tax=Candidatus Magnetaquicoccus inordinatus TaxID=2496818 RepID=UPI00102AD595|nr:4'-phosphopantetheinyl transferase superfamily protein [Candidatus Magnetaquicoccus inordinatus]